MSLRDGSMLAPCAARCDTRIDSYRGFSAAQFFEFQLNQEAAAIDAQAIEPHRRCKKNMPVRFNGRLILNEEKTLELISSAVPYGVRFKKLKEDLGILGLRDAMVLGRQLQNLRKRGLIRLKVGRWVKVEG
jgi:hypothetical protein